MTVGQKIRQLRKKAKVSPLYLGVEIGKAQSTVYDYERDKTVPDLNCFLAICNFFDVTPNEFLKGVDKE